MFVLCIFQMESRLWIFVGILLKSLKLHLLAPEFAIIEQIQMVSFAIPLLLLSMNFHIMMRSIGQPHVDMKWRLAECNALKSIKYYTPDLQIWLSTLQVPYSHPNTFPLHHRNMWTRSWNLYQVCIWTTSWIRDQPCWTRSCPRSFLKGNGLESTGAAACSRWKYLGQQLSTSWRDSIESDHIVVPQDLHCRKSCIDCPE